MPSSFSATTMTDELISSLDMIHEPEVHRKLVGRYPMQRELNWIKEMGKLIEVKQTEYHHHEENELFDQIVIASKSNSGSNVIVTIHSDNHYNSGANSFPRIGDLVQFKNRTTGLVIAKSEAVASAHTITIKPINSSQLVQTAAIASDTFICFSSAWEEGTSGYTKSLIPTHTKITSKTQIFTEFFDVTSSEETNQTYITYTNPETGEAERRYYIKGEADTADRFVMKEELGLFATPYSDTSLTNAAGDKVRTTRGMIPHLEDYGNVLSYTDGASSSLYDTIVKRLNKKYAEKEYLMLEGLNFSITNKNFHVDFGKNGSVVYNPNLVKMGFKGIEMNGYKFMIKTLDILNHAATLGATGFPYPDYFIMAPTGKGYDSKAAEYVDYFAVRYKKMNGGGSRGHFQVWETGGSAKSNQDGSLKRQIRYASEKGLQVFGGERFILGKKL